MSDLRDDDWKAFIYLKRPAQDQIRDSLWKIAICRPELVQVWVLKEESEFCKFLHKEEERTEIGVLGNRGAEEP